MLEFGIILLVLLVIGYSFYAKGIRLKVDAREAASAIDVQLQKRRDLIPNILKIAKRFMEHEQGLLTELTGLRSRIAELPNDVDPEGMKKRISFDNQVGKAMMNFFATAEAYPDLKSNEQMNTAQETFTEVEGHIAASRRFYNSSVADLNIFCEQVPMSWFAGLAGAKPMPFFEATEEAREAVDADEFL